jgi:hypothetical protein
MRRPLLTKARQPALSANSGGAANTCARRRCARRMGSSWGRTRASKSHRRGSYDAAGLVAAPAAAPDRFGHTLTAAEPSDDHTASTSSHTSLAAHTLSGHHITAEHAAEFGKSAPSDPPYDRVQLPGHRRQSQLQEGRNFGSYDHREQGDHVAAADRSCAFSRCPAATALRSMTVCQCPVSSHMARHSCIKLGTSTYYR